MQTQVRVWCSDRAGTCTAGGLGFESRQPRSHEIHAKNVGDGWMLAGGGASIDKKNSFFWVKIPIFWVFFGFNFAECRHSAKALPSARQKTLGKDVFADTFFAEWSLPSAALGKAFAECKLGWHSAKPVSPVVFSLIRWLTLLLH